MNKFIHILLSAFASLTILSCSSGVENADITPDKLVAVSCWISPQDSLIQAYVYQVQPVGTLLNPDNALIPDATVRISTTGRSALLVFDEKSKSYSIPSSEFKINASEQYHLETTTSNGQRLTASCRVPQSVDSLAVEGDQEASDYLFFLHWPDKTIAPYFLYDFGLTGVSFKPQAGSVSPPSLGFTEGNNLFDSERLPSFPPTQRIRNAFRAESISLKTSFYNLDENAFQFIKTNRDAESWNTNSGGLIPNLRDPQPVFSNVEGGTGIFGAYNQTSLLLKIK